MRNIDTIDKTSISKSGTGKNETYRMDRRTFVKMAGATAGALAFGGSFLRHIPSAAAQIQLGSLDPLTIPKYVSPLVIPPVMPRSKKPKAFRGDYYEIAVRQFTQQILPASMPVTPVWSYGSVNHAGTFNYPAFTIEAKYKKPVRVKWINDLKDASGNFLPHLLPVDPTLHWANPPGGIAGRDMQPTFTTTPGPYTGPVPLVVHLHGGHSTEESDGFTEAWYLPDAKNIPPGFARVGSQYDAFKAKFEAAHPGVTWQPGTAVFEYDNNQRASTLWYHDHTLGMTRNNVYAGPAGFYLLRGGPADLKLGYNPPRDNKDRDDKDRDNRDDEDNGDHGHDRDDRDDEHDMDHGHDRDDKDNEGPITEIPIAIQDRSFNSNGSLFYPDSRAFFDGFTGPYIPGSDIPPIWNPEFFGNTIVVNGKTWPFLKVEKRRYRFRFLNGSNSRFLILKMSNNMPFYQIGSEGGFLPQVQQLSQLLIAPAERADVIVDFTNIPEGTQIILQNIGPDEPFGGGVPGVDFTPADPATTGQVMRFDVVERTSHDNTKPPAKLKLPKFSKLGLESVTRQVSLNEADSDVLPGVGPRAAFLGTVNLAGDPTGVSLKWDDPITENPAVNAIEVWEIYNFTPDAHPIHIHEVQFQVVNRQVIGGAIRAPELWETGDKDTVIAYPGEITRVKALYDRAGLFVWHCHIVEHEDNEMMRPYFVGPLP